jgi:hypothetical protein
MTWEPCEARAGMASTAEPQRRLIRLGVSLERAREKPLMTDLGGLRTRSDPTAMRGGWPIGGLSEWGQVVAATPRQFR